MRRRFRAAKIIIIFVCLMTLLCMCLTVGVQAQTVNSTVTVTKSTIIKPSDSRILGYDGFCSTYASTIYINNNASTDIAPDFITATKGNNLPMPFMRMGGTESQAFNWKTSIGPLESRGFYYVTGYANPTKPNIGIVEYIKGSLMINPNCQFIYDVNIYDDPSDDADLVRFLTLMPDDPNAIGGGGINWAQKRVDCGLPDPVKIAAFELGNEQEYGIPDSAALTEKANWYIGICQSAIQAMKTVNPNIKFSAILKTAASANVELTDLWNSKIIGSLGTTVNYLSMHYYYTLPETNFYWVEVARIGNEVTAYTKNIDPAKRPKIIFTEHGVWTDYSPAMDKTVSDLAGVLETAQFINRIGMRSDVAMMNYHALSGDGSQFLDGWTGWGILRRFTDGTLYSNGIAEMMKTLYSGFGVNIVKTTAKGNQYCYDDSTSTSTGPFLSASAQTTAEGGLNLILVNVNPDVSHNITFNFGNSYKLAKETILTSNNLTDNNDPINPDALYSKTMLINSSSALTNFTMPAKSIVVLNLVPMGTVYPPSQVADVQFENISSYNGGLPVVNSDDGHLSIKCNYYNGQGVGDLQEDSLLILKPGVSYDSFQQNSDMDNVSCFSQATVKRDIANFDVYMPQGSPDGIYTAVIGNRAINSDAYQTVQFVYEPSSLSLNITNATVNGTGLEVNNVDYRIDASVQFGKSINTGEKFTILVVKGNNSDLSTLSSADKNKVVYISQDVKKSDKQNFTIFMPQGASAEDYTLALGYQDSSGNMNYVKKAFSFVKPNEKVSVVGDPVNQNNQEITLGNIMGLQNIKVPVKNFTDNSIVATAIVGLYDSDCKIIKMTTGVNTVLVTGNGTLEVPVKIDAEIAANVDTVRIFIWGDIINIEPLTAVYYIK